MAVRLRNVAGLLLLMFLGGLFLRLTVFLPDDTYDPTLPGNDKLEEVRVKQAQQIQHQLDRIKDLEEKVVNQQKDLARKQQEKEEAEQLAKQRVADILSEKDMESQQQRDSLDMALQERERLEAAVKEREREIQQQERADKEWEEYRSHIVDTWPPHIVVEWARRVCKLEQHDLPTFSNLNLQGTDLLKLKKEDLLDAGFDSDVADRLYSGIEKLANPPEKSSGGKGDSKKPKYSPTIAVIGAGFAGIGATREIAENGGIPILIEEAKKPGGIWIYDPDPETVSGYHSLYAQGAPADVNLRGWVIAPDAPRTLSIHQITNHLKTFWDHHELGKYATYNKHVTGVESRWPKESTWKNWIDPVMEGKKMIRVHYDETIHKEMEVLPEPNPDDNSTLLDDSPRTITVTEIIKGYYDVDGAVVSVGRNHIPNLPSTKPEAAGKYIPGLAEFTGVHMHSTHYRLPSQFELNSTVIVSGGGKSGQDIYEDLKNSKSYNVYHASSHTGTRNRIKNITKEADGTFTVYFDMTGKPEGKAEPVRDVKGIVWCWGYQWMEIPVNGTQGQAGGFYNDVIYKGFPGITRSGTQGILASSRPQSVYVGRVLTGRIPLPDFDNPKWNENPNWNGVGRDQYLWHELTTY